MTEKKSIYDERVEESKKIIYNALENIFKNASLLDRFLNVVSLFDFSAQDCLLVAEIMPQASHFGTFNDWQDKGYRINKGEKGIAFIDYEKNTKKVWFDVSQTTAPKDIGSVKDTLTYREKMRALLSNNNFHLFVVNETNPNTNYTHGKPVFFEPKNNCMFFDLSATSEKLYPALAEEIAHSYLYQALGKNYSREKCETIAQMASYITCKKNSFTPESVHISKDLQESDTYEVKAVLDNVRLAADKIDDNIQYFYENGKDKLERPKPPPRRVTLDENKEEIQKNSKNTNRKSIRNFIKNRKNNSGFGADKHQPKHFKEDKGGKK